MLTLCERTGILTIFLSNFLLVPNLAFSFVITNAYKWSLKYCLFPLYPKTMVLTQCHVPCDVDESERIQYSGGYLISDCWKIRNPEHRAGGLVALNNPPFVTLPISRSIGIFLSEFFLDDCTQWFTHYNWCVAHYF